MPNHIEAHIEIVLPGGGAIVIPVPQDGREVAVRLVAMENGVRKVKRYSLNVCLKMIRFFSKQ